MKETDYETRQISKVKTKVLQFMCWELPDRLQFLFFVHKLRLNELIMQDSEKILNRPFYPCGGHIEVIRFKEYYGMPRGNLPSIYARFSGKKRTSLYISPERGDHYYIQTRHNDLYFPVTIFL